MYSLKELPYEYDALEPYIDTHTLGLHRNKHQKKYLDNLNKLLIKNNYSFSHPLEKLVRYVKDFSKDREDILFNLGGVINHNIYFSSMNPKGEKPTGVLLQKIKDKYGSYEKFKMAFKEKALSLKGSGYTYFVYKNNELELINLQNQDNPYNYDYIPIICIDMWEHAYYINYENYKEIYIDNFLEIVDFQKANKIFNVV